jgi:hypothetical protein
MVHHNVAPLFYTSCLAVLLPLIHIILVFDMVIKPFCPEPTESSSERRFQPNGSSWWLGWLAAYALQFRQPNHFLGQTFRAADGSTMPFGRHASDPGRLG